MLNQVLHDISLWNFGEKFLWYKIDGFELLILNIYKDIYIYVWVKIIIMGHSKFWAQLEGFRKSSCLLLWHTAIAEVKNPNYGLSLTLICWSCVLTCCKQIWYNDLSFLGLRTLIYSFYIDNNHDIHKQCQKQCSKKRNII